MSLSSSTAQSPTFTAPTELLSNASLVFSLTVSDGVNTSTADTVTITVTAGANDAPTADAGSDATVAEGATVTLDGSGSDDPENAALTYSWSQTSGTTVSLSSSTAQSPTFTAPTELLSNASLVFSLTVSDGVNTSTADTVTITVTAGANDAPTADAGSDATVAEGANVTLDGSGSDDPENAALTYAWSQTSGTTVSLSSSTAQSPTFTAPTELLSNASLVFSLTVSDGVNTSTADTVTITVTAGANDAPTADAGTNQTVAEGANVTLDGSGSDDPENAALTYAWSQTSGSTVSLSSSTAQSPTFTAPTELLSNASLVFSLTVSDGVNTSTADTVTITVTAGANDAPTADAGSDATVAEGASVTLDGSGSDDPENAALTYSWSQTSGTTVSLSSSTAQSPTFTAPDGTAVQRLAGVLSHRLRRSEHLHRRHGDDNGDGRSQRRAHGRRRFGRDGGGRGYGYARRKRQRRSRERGSDLRLEPDLGNDGVSEFLHCAESDFHRSRRNCCPTPRWCSLSPSPTE